MSAAKIPVLGTAVASFAALRPGIQIAVDLIWFPLVVELLLNVVMFLLFPELLVGDKSLPVGLLQMAVSLIGVLVAIPAITAWHRLVILGHGPASRLRYSLGKEEWRYTGALLIIVALVMVLQIGVVFILPGKPPERGSVAEDIWAAFVTVIAVWPLARWLMVLPATAIGHKLGGREAERLGRGHQTRLWAVLMLAAAPFWIVDVVLQAVLLGEENKIVEWSAALAYTALSAVNFCIALLVGATALSLCYRQLADRAVPA